MPDDLITLSGHTEGPWNVSRTLLPPYAVDGVWSDKGDHIASFVLMTELDKRVKEDNARLIAAAPALLAIATELHRFLTALGYEDGSRTSFEMHGIAPPELPEMAVLTAKDAAITAVTVIAPPASADAVGRDGE